MREFLSMVSLGLLLTSCASAVAPAPQTSVETPSSWSDGLGAEGRISETWWEDFGDPVLESLIHEALQHNYDLAQAAANLDAALAVARQAGADLYPQLGAGLNGWRRKQNFVGFSGLTPSGEEVPLIVSTSNVFGVSLDLSWELDLWGRLRAGRDAALADAEAARALFEGARLSIAGQVGKAWFALIEAGEQLELARHTVASYEASVEQVSARYDRGIRPALDLRLALAEFAGASALVERRKAERDAAARQLEILLGRYPAAELEAVSRLADPPAAIPAGLPADLVSRRPDVAAAEKNFAASAYRARQARKALYPSFSLSGSTGTSSDEFKSLLNGDFSVWSLAAGVVQPVFQGGRLRAAAAAAASQQDSELAAYVSKLLIAYREVEVAMKAEGFLEEQGKHLSAASEQSAAAQNLAEERYRSGLDDYVTVLTAQRRALEARSTFIELRRERLQNRVDLYLALGGGFSLTEPGTGGDRSL